MDRVVVTNLIIYSIILGLLLGTLGAVPYIGIWMLVISITLSAPLVMVYLIMDSKLDLTTIKDSIITGAIIGFCNSLIFSASYSIVVAILFKCFHYTNNQVLTSIIINSPMWLLVCFMIFIGVFNATTNAFSGFTTYYVINFIRDMYEKNHPIKLQDEDFNEL